MCICSIDKLIKTISYHIYSTNKTFKMIKLKNNLYSLMLVILLPAVGTSCNKETDAPGAGDTIVNKKIQYTLYTDKDFSGLTDSIEFSLFVQNLHDQVIWDSALMPMELKDIPGIANKIVAEKVVTLKKDSLYKVGFKYIIDEVGHSSFFDTLKANDTFKEISFNFK